MTEIIEDIDKRRKTSFTISSIPVSLLKDFKKFCKEECGDIYWVGIKLLLERWHNYKEYSQQLLSLKREIEELKEKKSKKEVVTFANV